MIRSARHLLGVAFLVAAASFAGAGAGVAAHAEGRSSAASAPAGAFAPGALAARPSRSDTTLVERVRVNWKGGWKKRDYVNTASIPGIGTLDLICRPQETRIRLYTDDRGRETQMWLQKYETKNGRPVVAIKTPRIYRWAHADDNGQGGTGYYAAEGLNQHPGIENRSQDGYMYGVISQRSSRSDQGPQVASPLPVTTFELDWNWNGFAHPLRYRSCSIDAVFTTQFPAESRLGVTWRGSGAAVDPTEPETTTGTLPGIGQITLSCPRDRSVAPTVSIRPTPSDPPLPDTLYVEDVRGEGPVADKRTTSSYRYDDGAAELGPVALPPNGSLRMQVTHGDAKQWLLLSSYWVTNDPRPTRNVCEIAAGYYSR